MEILAEGFNVFDTEKSPSGTVKYLDAPKDVIALIQSGKLKDHILLVRGGTTTFLAPALSMGAIGVITMSGAPESHLGILSREFQTPCVMTAYLTTSDSRYEVGNTDESTHTRLSTSWKRPKRSTTLVLGSSPIRAVPMT